MALHGILWPVWNWRILWFRPSGAVKVQHTMACKFHISCGDHEFSTRGHTSVAHGRSLVLARAQLAPTQFAWFVQVGWRTLARCQVGHMVVDSHDGTDRGLECVHGCACTTAARARCCRGWPSSLTKTSICQQPPTQALLYSAIVCFWWDVWPLPVQWAVLGTPANKWPAHSTGECAVSLAFYPIPRRPRHQECRHWGPCIAVRRGTTPAAEVVRGFPLARRWSWDVYPYHAMAVSYE